MKSFVLKTILIFFSTYLLYQFTIGHEVKNLKNKIEIISNKEEREKIKSKIIREIESGLKKDYYFEEKERKIISRFLKKIFKELELIDN